MERQWDLESFAERASRRLEMFFRRCEKKHSCLLIDPCVRIATGRIVKPVTIEECFKKIFTYESIPTELDFECMLIFTNGEISNIEQYAKIISSLSSFPSEITMVFTNRCNFLVNQCLERYGIIHLIKIEELRLPLWVPDTDLSTLEYRHSFRDIIFGQIPNLVRPVFNALTSIPCTDMYANVYSIGAASCEVLDQIRSDYHTAWTDIIVFDRTVDMITPFLTCFSYEALVAEEYDMDFGIIEVQEENCGHLLFANEDPLSRRLRNLHVSAASNELSRVIHELTVSYGHAHEVQKNGINLESFEKIALDTLDNQSVVLHQKVMERVLLKGDRDPAFKVAILADLSAILDIPKKSLLEEILVLAKDPFTAIRILTLYSMVKQDSKYEEYRQRIIDRFGIYALGILWTLYDAGIVKEGQQCPYGRWLKHFYKYNENFTGAEDPYSGFVPLIITIVKTIVNNGWQTLEQKFRSLGTPAKALLGRSTQKQKILVVCIGGLMYGEATCLRILSEELGIKIEMVTTEMLSTRGIFKQLSEP